MIRLDGVTKVYPIGTAAVTALAGIDLEIAAGSLTALVGRSGSGKSTLLHLLAAMDTPTTGEITVGSYHLATMDRPAQTHYRRAMVGLLFQDFNLVRTMTAFDNVALPLLLAGMVPADRRARASACLEMVGLTHRSHHRPTELSGGEQQRVALARALANDPPLLLADEPTGNLDSTTAAEIIGLLATLQREQGKTILLATHHLSDIAPTADHIITLHDGQVVDFGF